MKNLQQGRSSGKRKWFPVLLVIGVFLLVSLACQVYNTTPTAEPTERATRTPRRNPTSTQEAPAEPAT
jgi:hypothetical protein